jgi:glycosyltransferase involved in cell wall biosynthesis
MNILIKGDQLVNLSSLSNINNETINIFNIEEKEKKTENNKIIEKNKPIIANKNIETNKYPFILFFRYPQYSKIDDFLIINKNKLNCSIYFIDNPKNVIDLFNPNYPLLITFGPSQIEYNDLLDSVIPKRIQNRRIHLTQIVSIEAFNELVNRCFIEKSVISRINIRPVFSICTSTYNSYEKIIRCYNSIKNQIFLDWEWIIVEDSPDDAHFQYLKGIISKDPRVRLYRRSENSGNIGNVKNESVSLSRGKYILELDHDDEIVNTCLSDSATYFDDHSDVGFIYMDFINIYENGKNYRYSDFICKGYGGYYCQKYNDQWRYVYITPNINNITLTHLVCCPNHPRIWRKQTLIDCGNYCETLPICDDYEILLNTALNTKMAKIHKLGYIQYMNDSNNNFSLIRNGEINRIGPQYISNIFYEHYKIHEKMLSMNAYEDPKYAYQHSQIWKRDSTTFKHKYCNNIVNTDYIKQYCFIGVDAFMNNLEHIYELYKYSKHDFILLDNKISNENLWEIIDSYKLDRFKCYHLENSTDLELINYFLLLYKSTDDILIITK